MLIRQLYDASFPWTVTAILSQLSCMCMYHRLAVYIRSWFLSSGFLLFFPDLYFILWLTTMLLIFVVSHARCPLSYTYAVPPMPSLFCILLNYLCLCPTPYSTPHEISRPPPFISRPFSHVTFFSSSLIISCFTFFALVFLLRDVFSLDLTLNNSNSNPAKAPPSDMEMR
ncbi:hypothetical protein BDV93DRAFT_202687 [Ceratobasidium sp. AG-I]|nr:hypothetical protein BDV93DRAFT_202687 [Ceratobasidium sp. AG-I]